LRERVPTRQSQRSPRRVDLRPGIAGFATLWSVGTEGPSKQVPNAGDTPSPLRTDSKRRDRGSPPCDARGGHSVRRCNHRRHWLPPKPGLNIPAGFPMPPRQPTRLVAALSVLGSAPALVAFAYSMRILRPTGATTVAFALSMIFAALAVANRLIQLVALPALGKQWSLQLDVYATNALAQGAEMLAWGGLFGVVTLVLVAAIREVAGTLPARLLGVAGMMSLVAGLVYALTAVATLSDWIGGAAAGVGGLAWAIVWPASAACFIANTRSRRSWPECLDLGVSPDHHPVRSPKRR
jgi:hypothetical protein